MAQVEIPIKANDESWRERRNGRIKRLKSTPFSPSDSSSQLFQEKLSVEKKFMSLELYQSVQSKDAHKFVDQLEKIVAEKKLSLSDVVVQVTQAGDSLLHVAAHFGADDIAELICIHFAELLTKKNIKGNTALHVAARANNSNAVRLILSQYAESSRKVTRITNECGDTPLHEAVHSNNNFEAVFDLLVADKEVVHHFNKAGKSPLYIAVLYSDKMVIDLLLKASFQEDKVLNGGSFFNILSTIVFHQIREKFMTSMRENRTFTSRIKILISRKFMIAINTWLPQPQQRLLFKTLVDRSALPRYHGILLAAISRRDSDGRTPLHYAALVGYSEGVRELLRHRSTQLVLEWDKEGHLPIHLACKMGHVEVVEEFLKLEWPRVRDMLTLKGQSILHVAAENGQNRMVKYLLEGSRLEPQVINEKDNNGNTALHLASKKFYSDVVMSLEGDNRIDFSIKNDLAFSDVLLQDNNVPMETREDNVRMETREGKLFSPKWINDRVNTIIIVAALIATVTFAAGFTVPGSVYSSDKPDSEFGGLAILGHRAMFKMFMICNTIAMYSSKIACVSLMSAQLQDMDMEEKRFLFVLGLCMLGLALSTMSLTFMAAARLVVSNVSWLANLVTVNHNQVPNIDV